MQQKTLILAPKLMEFIEVSDPKVAKAGLRIQFMYDATDGEEAQFIGLKGEYSEGSPSYQGPKSLNIQRIILE